MRVLLISPFYDKTAPGECWSSYKWLQGISEHCETVVLTQHYAGWDAGPSPLGAAKVVNWTDPDLPRWLTGRAAFEIAPTYVHFYHRARRWLKESRRAGEHFDLVHQISPLALRYPCPARGLGYKYVVGPLAGSLSTPPGFADQGTDRQWFRKLRHLDRVRFRWDPWLRGSYEGAAALLGAAPYVKDLLSDLKLRRFECMSETGVEEVVGKPISPPGKDEPLRLLFVGRMIRTKGVLDGIRAMGLVRDVNVRLDILGGGDLTEVCKDEVERLGLSERVAFHGHLSREEVFGWYRKSHVFFFPSFREPSGNVVFEAMSQGLPVITSTVGGPGYVVDSTCGRCVAPENPEVYPARLADAVRDLAADPARLVSLSSGALRRMEEVALWKHKIPNLIALYRELIDSADSSADVRQISRLG